MPPPTDSPLTPTNAKPAPFREARVILVADLVESVLLMQADEEGLIGRLRDFIDTVVRVFLPAHRGRLVKSTGDGLLAEFDDAPAAAATAVRMHRWMADCKPLLDGSLLALRIGIHAASIYRTPDDLFGVGVNLAARIASVAASGETIATAETRDRLIDTFDATIEDLGDCYLKHIPEPVRLYRLGPALHPTSLHSEISRAASLRPSIAVLPFRKTMGSDEFRSIGELLADSLIAQLSIASEIHVVSRLSSQALGHRSTSLPTISACLGVRYIVSGSFFIDGPRIIVLAELADASTSEVVWTGKVAGNWQDLLAVDSDIVHRIYDEILRRLLETNATKAMRHPLPALKSYELFLGGVALMHRANPKDFAQSRVLLEALADRHRRIALPRAWLGKWYVLAATQGIVDDSARAARVALEHTHRALDLEPESAFALAIEGFVHCHLHKDLETGRDRLTAACDADPNESLAWLFYAVLEAFVGNGTLAVEAGTRALALSPMDPLRYYYESLMGSCSLAAGNLDDAIRWCEFSRRRNRYHLSTLRVLITAYAESGREADARTIAQELLRLRRTYTVAGYESRSVAAMFPFGQRIVRAMRGAGIP